MRPLEASKKYNVSKQTLRRWSKSGKIKSIKTKGGHRRYMICDEDDEDNKDNNDNNINNSKDINNSNDNKNNKNNYNKNNYNKNNHNKNNSNKIKNKKNKILKNIIYVRVSSENYKKDLDRQIKILSNLYPEHKLVTDIGSSIDYNRKGFRNILRQVFNNKINTVVVIHKDKWCRFGFKMFEDIFKMHGSKLVVCKTNYQTSGQEFAEEIMSITSVFTSRYHKTNKMNKTNKIIS